MGKQWKVVWATSDHCCFNVLIDIASSAHIFSQGGMSKEKDFHEISREIKKTDKKKIKNRLYFLKFWPDDNFRAPRFFHCLEKESFSSLFYNIDFKCFFYLWTLVCFLEHLVKILVLLPINEMLCFWIFLLSLLFCPKIAILFILNIYIVSVRNFHPICAYSSHLSICQHWLSVSIYFHLWMLLSICQLWHSIHLKSKYLKTSCFKGQQMPRIIFVQMINLDKVAFKPFWKWTNHS